MAAQAVGWMAAAAVVCSAALMALTSGTGSRLAVLLGAAGPFAAAGASWMLVVRVHRRAPEQVSALMIKLFAAKLVLFGGYVALVVKVLEPGNVVAFVVSFTSHYILLHMMEALYFRRLFAGDRHAL